MGSYDLWARSRKTVCDVARFPWSCVNFIRSRKMLETAFLDLFISKFSGRGGGGACLRPSRPPSLACAWYPRLQILYPRQLEILVTALYVLIWNNLNIIVLNILLSFQGYFSGWLCTYS